VFSTNKPDYWADRKLSGYHTNRNESAIISNMSLPMPNLISANRVEVIQKNTRTTMMEALP